MSILIVALLEYNVKYSILINNMFDQSPKKEEEKKAGSFFHDRKVTIDQEGVVLTASEEEERRKGTSPFDKYKEKER